MEITRREALGITAASLLLPFVELTQAPAAETVQRGRQKWQLVDAIWGNNPHKWLDGYPCLRLALEDEGGIGLDPEAIKRCPETCYRIQDNSITALDLYPNNCTLMANGHDCSLTVIYLDNAWEHVFELSQSDYYLALSHFYRQAGLNTKDNRTFMIEGEYANSHLIWRGANIT